MQTGKPDLEKTTVKKQELTAALKQMADGGIFYKQFGQQMLRSKKVFDPLQCDKATPDHCGFGVRFL